MKRLASLLLAAASVTTITNTPARAADCPCPFETGTGERFAVFSQLEYVLQSSPHAIVSLTGDCIAGEYEDRIPALTRQWQDLMMPPSNYDPDFPDTRGIYNGPEKISELTERQDKFMREAAIIKSPIRGVLDGQHHALYGNGRYIVGVYALHGLITHLRLDLSTEVSCEKPTS